MFSPLQAPHPPSTALSALRRKCVAALALLTFWLPAVAASAQECVVLLHGLARTEHSMARLEEVLLSEGFTVANVGYPSRYYPIRELAPMALGEGLQRCRAQGATTIHMVTHSLGGILVRAYLAGNQVPELGRVVMLGPPNQGSEVVDTFSLLPGFALWNGPAGEELGTSPGSVPNQLGPVTFPVGVIAGTRSLNPLLSTAFSEENDGKVAVSRTKVEGMTDFIALPISHPLMMREPAAIRQTLEFLRSGHFMADETASSGIQVPDPDGSQ